MRKMKLHTRPRARVTRLCYTEESSSTRPRVLLERLRVEKRARAQTRGTIRLTSSSHDVKFKGTSIVIRLKHRYTLCARGRATHKFRRAWHTQRLRLFADKPDADVAMLSAAALLVCFRVTRELNSPRLYRLRFPRAITKADGRRNTRNKQQARIARSSPSPSVSLTALLFKRLSEATGTALSSRWRIYCNQTLIGNRVLRRTPRTRRFLPVELTPRLLDMRETRKHARAPFERSQSIATLRPPSPLPPLLPHVARS